MAKYETFFKETESTIKELCRPKRMFFGLFPVAGLYACDTVFICKICEEKIKVHQIGRMFSNHFQLDEHIEKHQVDLMKAQYENQKS